MRKEDTFKPTTGNECLHDIRNDTKVTVVNFVMSAQCSHITTSINTFALS